MEKIMRLRGKTAVCAVAAAAAFTGLTVTAASATATAPATASPVLAPAAESPCPYSGSHPILRIGSSGAAVKHAQCLINLYGYGISVDGRFGSETNYAVKDVQGRCRITRDGAIGLNTWNCLHPDKLPNPR
ncbi:peptidoglycan-binding domain-containing protein [Amycolatopsis suaedae]|nr:peptidoglycan-binding domain-containing protein [Amycolatopsis suaedae]